MELLLFVSGPVRTEIHYEVHSPVFTKHTFFRVYSGVSPSGVRHICHNVISQVSLSRDDIVFAVLEVPVSPQIYVITRGELSYHQEVSVPERVGQDMWVADGVAVTRHPGRLASCEHEICVLLHTERLFSVLEFPVVHFRSPLFLVLACSPANVTQSPPAGLHRWLQAAVIKTAVLETDNFASSTCYYSIITSVHVKWLVVGNTGHFQTTRSTWLAQWT